MTYYTLHTTQQYFLQITKLRRKWAQRRIAPRYSAFIMTDSSMLDNQQLQAL